MSASAMLMNGVSATVPQKEGADRKGLAGQASEKTQRRFAVILPLVSTKGELKPDKNMTNGIPGGNKQIGGQIATDVLKPEDGTARENKGASVVVIAPLVWDASVPAAAVKGRLRADLPGVTLPQPATARVKAATGALSPVRPQDTPQCQTHTGGGASTEPQVISEKVLTDAQAQAIIASDGAYLVNGPAGSPKPVGGTGVPVPPQSPQVPGRAVASQTVPSVVRGAETTAEATVTKDRSDRIADPQVHIAKATDAGSSTPVPAKTSVKDQRQAAENGSDQNPEKAQSAERNSRGEAPSESVRSGDVLRWDARQSVLPDHDTSVASQGVKKEVPQAGEKETSPTGQKDGLSARPEMMPATRGETTIFSQRVSVQPQGGADVPVPRSPTRDIGEQILDSVHASLTRGDKQVTVRLQPPELGTVVVRLREQGEHISALLEVSKNDIRREIEQALPQVLRSLQDAGVQIRRFEVVTSDQPQRDFARNQMQQDAWPQQHGSDQGHDHPQTPAQARWPQSETSHPAEFREEPNPYQQSVAAPGRINMLL
jgi:flagellar hook-length control protein FliK